MTLLQDNHMVIFAVVAQGLRPSISSIETAEEDLVSLCQQCWSTDPAHRPSAKAVIGLLEGICADHDLHVRKALF